MQVLNQKIVDIIDTITDIQVVYDHPFGEFSGYPAVTVFPSGNSSDYETTAENIRTYAFQIHLFVDISAIQKDANGNNVTGQAQLKEAYRVTRSIVDQIIDKFDQDETLSGISLPAGKQMVSVRPAPSAVELIPDTNTIVSQINLECRIVFDVT